MTYTNFAYYYRPHGWYPRHNPERFAVMHYFKPGLSPVARDYLMRRIVAEIGRHGIYLKDLRIASSHSAFDYKIRCRARQIAQHTIPAWNVGNKFDRDLDMGAGL